MSSYNFPCPPDYEMKVTEDALALAVSGDTAPSGGLTAGKYIFLTGHSTLPDGGYHVKDTDIGAGETLSASNIEADGEGFANALNAKVSELNSNITTINSKSGNLFAPSDGLNRFSTQAATEAYLNSKLSGMESGNICMFPIYPDYSGSMTNGQRAICFMTKMTAGGSATAVFITFGGAITKGSRENGTWSWS